MSSPQESRPLLSLVPVHVFVKPDLYANPEAVDFGPVSAEELQKNPAARELLAQNFPRDETQR